MTMMCKQNSPRKAGKPRPVADAYAFVLLDTIEEQFDLIEHYRSDGRHDPRNPEPAHQRAKARFWQNLTRQIDEIWGGAPRAVAGELRELCREVAP